MSDWEEKIDEDDEDKKTWTYYVKLILVIVMVLVLVTVTILFLIPNSPVREPMLRAIEWLQSQPTWAKGMLMVALFLLALPIGIPSTPLELCSGFIFGWLMGSFFAMIGATIGAIICFWWGKLLLIKWSERQQRKKKLIRAICYAVRKEALKLVILCRLSPVLPSSIMNYLFSTTGMSFWTYLLGSIIGDIPWVLCYCYIGSVSKSLTDAFNDTEGGALSQILFLVLGIGATIILLILVTWIGKREISKAMNDLNEIEAEEILPLKTSEHKQSDYTTIPVSSNPLVGSDYFASNDHKDVSNNSHDNHPNGDDNITINQKSGYDDDHHHNNHGILQEENHHSPVDHSHSPHDIGENSSHPNDDSSPFLSHSSNENKE